MGIYWRNSGSITSSRRLGLRGFSMMIRFVIVDECTIGRNIFSRGGGGGGWGFRLRVHRTIHGVLSGRMSETFPLPLLLRLTQMCRSIFVDHVKL